MTGKQAQIFLSGEGQAWLERNVGKLPPEEDPVLAAFDKIKIKPTFVLEVGCANGWRLLELRKQHGCVCEGIDPAIKNFTRADQFVHLRHGTADNLAHFGIGMQDAIIYGFCLYLCDPEDYFQIVAEGNRTLNDGGYIIIYDFYSPYAYSNRYQHAPGVYSHKMDFAKLWLCHPAYRLVTQNIIGSGDNATAVSVLQKQMKNSFPVKE